MINDQAKSKVVLASGNAGKLREFFRILGEVSLNGSPLEIVPQSDYDVEDVPETGLSFVENAIIKARNASKQTGLPALSDDSGIEVDALKGQPGIYSARYAKMNDAGSGDQDNNMHLLKSLENVPEEQRTARFRCCIVFMRHAEDPSPLIADGHWEGSILMEPSGAGGFGYDPLFFVPTHGVSSGELDADEKNRISHRGLALQKMLKLMSEN